MNRTGYSRSRNICLAILLGGLLLATGKAAPAAECEGPQHYKMISTLEYVGNGQFRNQLETVFTVKKEPLSDNKAQFLLSSNDFDSALSFVVDTETQQLLSGSEELEFLAEVTNQCGKSLTKLTGNNIGKTWKQSLDLSTLGGSLPGKLKFTLTAMQPEKVPLGKMIAARALSEPFVIKIRQNGVAGTVKARINTVYLFDSEVDDVYLSISAFEAVTNINNFTEVLRHEVVTYKADATGAPIDLSGLGKDFEKFVGKLALSTKGLKVVKKSALPQWVQSEALRAAQAANICAAMTCEGAQNPVAMICIPAAHMVTLQGSGESAAAAGKAASPNIFQQIAANWGWNLPTAAVVGGATVGTIAIAGGFSSGGSSDRSPSN